MESAKVINKILLISLAVGGVTLGVGMLATKDGNLRKALIGSGAAISVASVAGIATKKKGSQNSPGINSSDFQKNEPNSQKVQLQPEKSSSGVTAKKEVAETNVNSFQVEQNQSENTAHNFKSQEQQPEPETNIWEEAISVPEPELGTENENNNDISLETEQASSELQQLSEVIAPIEEESENIDTQAETNPFNSTDAIDPSSDKSETVEELPVNPFANSADESVEKESQSNSELELADKLFGSFDNLEPQVSENSTSQVENIIEEESDFEIEEESELKSDRQELEMESAPVVGIESDDFMGEFIEESESVSEFSIDEESEGLMAGWGNDFEEPTSESEVEEMSLR